MFMLFFTGLILYALQKNRLSGLPEDFWWNRGSKQVMEYKGYTAKVDFDDDADIFHGEIINLRIEARKEGKSLNAWVNDALTRALKSASQLEA